MPIITIVLVTMFAGCVTPPSPEASPSEIVEIFASWHKDGDLDACYDFLMAREYRNTTNKSDFRDKIKQCKDYILISVTNEEIDGDIAFVEIKYMERSTDWPITKAREYYEGKSKTVKLVKEEDGWKLNELHCELKDK